MVWVPGGRFEFGDRVYPEEQVVQMVEVAGFWMDRTEVTNAQFAAFVEATGYVSVAERPVDAGLHQHLPPEMRLPGAVVFTTPNPANAQSRLTQWWRYIPGAQWRQPQGPGSDIADRLAHPVVAVSFEDAQAYARWRGRSLPTEMQWEWAARAGQTRSGQDHAQPQAANTWQGLFPVVNSAEDGFTGLAPVGCFAPNALGLWDMIGNAWELTADLYTPQHAPGLIEVAAPAAADVRPDSAVRQRVIKGGSYLCAPNYCARYRSSARQPQDEDLGTSHVGFRTVLKAPGP
jgi:sulfatase modifying factor 1